MTKPRLVKVEALFLKNNTKKRRNQNFDTPPSCDSAGIQTRNLLIRSQMLYSVELRSQTVIKLLAYEVTPLGFKPGTF